MTRTRSDWINDHFATITQDLTPASARYATCVLYAPVSYDSEISRRCEPVLSNAELKRANRFAAECHKSQFIQRRAFRRFCGALAGGSLNHLSQVVFDETENGRPYLPDWPNISFSFSSSSFGLLGAWSLTDGIGVDLEDQTKISDAVELAHWYFSETEAHAVERADGLERLQTFFRFWSLKEAALKSVGEGLPFGLDAFRFELDPQLRVIHAPIDFGGPELFDAIMIEGTGGCAALVMRNKV